MVAASTGNSTAIQVARARRQQRRPVEACPRIVVGILLGLLASYAGTRALGVPFVVVPQTVALAFVFSAGIGIAFGFFPARKAAIMNPIDVLRHE